MVAEFMLQRYRINTFIANADSSRDFIYISIASSVLLDSRLKSLTIPRHLPQNSQYLYHNIAATNDDDDVAMTAIFQNGVIYVFCRQYFVLLCPYGVVVNVVCCV